MAGIRTCDRESQVQRPNHYTTEPESENVKQPPAVSEGNPLKSSAPAGFSPGVGNEGVRSTEVPQRGLGAEPQWGSGAEAPRS